MSTPLVLDMLRERAALSGAFPAMYHLSGDSWRAITWRESWDRARTFAANLTKLGMERYDRIALALPNSPDWDCLQFAAWMNGAVVVALDAFDSDNNLEHALQLTLPRFCVCADSATLDRLRRLWVNSDIVGIVVGPVTSANTTHSLDELLLQPPSSSENMLEPAESDVATVVFSSGTTGAPKAIAYTHVQLTVAINAITQQLPDFGEQVRNCCWLPLSSMFQRIANLCAMKQGAATWFVSRPDHLLKHLTTINPTLLICVPRFLEKMHLGISERIAQLSWPARHLVNAALAVGVRHHRASNAGNKASFLLWTARRVADALVLRRIRRVLGSECRYLLSGSAPLAPWLSDWFSAAGWTVLEAYGVSENIVPIAMNTPSAARAGSVGRPLPENEVAIEPDGAIVVRGPGVCRAYYDARTSPDSNRAASPSEDDGFLRTGDFGKLDAEGYLWLNGRAADVQKTSTGLRVPVLAVEACLRRLPFIEHALVTARSRPFPIAILAIPHRNESAATSPPSRAQLAVIANEAHHACSQLPTSMQPGAYIVVRRAFSTSAGDLTSNFKLRRESIEARLTQHIDAAYRLAAALRTEPRTVPILEVQ